MQTGELMELIQSDTGRRWLRRTVRERLSSRRTSIGVRRDLTVPFSAPSASIPIVLRPVEPDDDLSFIDDEPGLPLAAAQHRADQRWLLNSELPPCLVAVDGDGAVRYMSWLLTSQDNPVIRRIWGDWIPQLKPDEAIIEGAFVSSEHRGLGILTDAACQMVALAEGLGVRYVIAYFSDTNVGPLRASKKAGFQMYSLREERWLLFRRRIRFFAMGESCADISGVRKSLDYEGDTSER